MWAPFQPDDAPTGRTGRPFADLKPEIGQVMSAVWQIVTNGSEAQRSAAIDVLVETRRKLYGILAEGDPVEEPPGPDPIDATGGADSVDRQGPGGPRSSW